MAIELCFALAGQGRPRLEVADIFRAASGAFRDRYVPTPDQKKVMAAVEQCRTAALGGHLDICTKCGHQAPAYNSCRNRHCPKCQSLTQAKWIEERRQRIIPTNYFHVVFTKDGRTTTVDAVEFVRRFLLHVLPAGFVKIRHYGLGAAANVNTKLETARSCLLNPDHDEMPKTPHPETPPSWRDLVFALTGIDLLACPVCGERTMERRPLGGAPASTRTPDTS